MDGWMSTGFRAIFIIAVLLSIRAVDLWGGLWVGGAFRGSPPVGAIDNTMGGSFDDLWGWGKS